MRIACSRELNRTRPEYETGVASKTLRRSVRFTGQKGNALMFQNINTTAEVTKVAVYNALSTQQYFLSMQISLTNGTH
jgi:hypothetical protein